MGFACRINLTKVHCLIFEIHHVSWIRSTNILEVIGNHCDSMTMNIALLHALSVRYRLENVTAKW